MTKRPLRIAMPTPSFLPNLGGIEVGLHNMAVRLKSRGHDPVVIVPVATARQVRTNYPDLPYCVAAFWPKMSGLAHTHPALALRMYQAFFRLFHKTHHVDVWHGTMIYPVGTGLSAAFGTSVPALIRAAGDDIQIDEAADYGIRRNKDIDNIVRRYGIDARAYVAITESVRKEYLALGIAAQRIHDIPNGVDVARFQSIPRLNDIRARFNIPAEAFMFLSVGRHHPKKNFSILLRAFSILKQKNPSFNAVLVLCGRGVSDLREQAAAQGVSNNVVFIDGLTPATGAESLQAPSDDLVALYRAADAFVFPSLIETFGIAIVEAMAAGLPALVADSPGCCDIAGQGAHAMMLNPLDADEWAAAMARVMDDTNMRGDLSRRALARARDFDWNHVVDLYEDLYYRLIAGEGAA